MFDRHLFFGYEVKEMEQNDSLYIMLNTVSKEIQKISQTGTLYFKSFPNDAAIGFNKDASNDKKLATAYYTYISAVADSISVIETSLSSIPEIMIVADRNACYEIISLCDELLNRYGELKKNISTFAENNEKMITENRISSTEMLRHLSELGYKINYFEEYLRSIEH